MTLLQQLDTLYMYIYHIDSIDIPSVSECVDIW